MSEIDFDFLKQQYTEFLSLVGTPEQERREGIIKIAQPGEGQEGATRTGVEAVGDLAVTY